MKEELDKACNKLSKAIAKNRSVSVASEIYRRKLALKAASAWSAMEKDYTTPDFREKLTGRG